MMTQTVLAFPKDTRKRRLSRWILVKSNADTALPSLLLVATFFLIQCSDTVVASNDVDSPPVDTRDILVVDPPGPIRVGYLDKIEFKVHLTDEFGVPVPNAPLDVAFMNQPHNAEVSPSQLLTDAEGSGTVAFVAPAPVNNEPLFDFDIRFRCADTETFVKVTVDPSLVAVSFEVNYTGQRAMDHLNAVLYRIDEETDTRTQVAGAEQAAVFPADFSFNGLLREQRYEAKISGLNGLDQLRAAAVLENLVPNSGNLTATLIDTSLVLTGTYQTEWEITTNGAVDWAFESLIQSPAMLQDTAKAILDGIENELSIDQSAKESFVTERTAADLDNTLATYLKQKGVDVKAAFDIPTQAAKKAVSRIRATGSLEIGKEDDGSMVGYHAIESITYGLDNDTPGPILGIQTTEHLPFDLEYGPYDTLEMAGHDLDLRLGKAATPLWESVLEKSFTFKDVARILQSIVDCPETAVFLEPFLSDVTVRPTVELGCIAAAEKAGEEMNNALASLNQVSRISISDGECTLEIPETGNQISKLEGDRFTATWHEPGTTDVPYMSIAYSAVLSTEP